MAPPPPPVPPLPRSRSSLTVGSAVGIPSSSSFSSRFSSKPSTASSSSTSSPFPPDDIDSDWELTENPSSLSSKPRKVLNMVTPLAERKAVGKGLPGRARLPSVLTRAGGELTLKAGAKAGVEPEGDKDRVLVCVRMKPPLPTSSIYDCSTETNTISLGLDHPNNKKRGGVIKGREQESEFSVDHLHLPPAPTEELFNKVVSPLVTAAMDGYDGTVFAYGMTGSGKTYTMGGVPEDPGVIPRAIDQIFDVIDADPTRETTLRVSYLELYNENFRDLLNPTASIPPSVHEVKGRIVVREVQDHTVRNPEDVQKLIKVGDANRRSGKTDWNEFSSRSHSIFTITIESRPLRLAGSTDEPTGPTQFSRLNLIDLAGSERAASDGERLKEGGYINKSLLVLGNVIEKLTESRPASHIPYRNSKLTRLLQDSLSGHARIAVICTVSFDEAHASEALATLKFARRASHVVTKAERGTVASDKSMIQMYQDQIAQLQAELAKAELATLARLKAPALRDSPNPQENSDSEDEGELLEEERARLRVVQEEKAKAEQDVYKLELKRTKLRSEITTLSEFTLRSETYAGPSASGSTQTLFNSRRRRISDIQSNDLGRGVPSSSPGGAAQRRHVSALGVVDEDAAGQIGKGRRGEGMMSGMAAVKEEGPSARELALEAELVEIRAQLAELQASQTSRTSEHGLAVDALAAKIATLEADLRRSSTESEEAVASIAKLQTDLAAATTERNQSTERATDLQIQIVELSQRQASDELSAQAQAASIAALQDQITALQTQLREQDDHVSAVQAQLVAVETARDASAQEASALLAEVRKEADNLTSQLVELQQSRTREVDVLQHELERTQAERDNLIATTQPSEVVQVRISSLEDQLAAQASSHAEKVEALEAQVEEAVSALATGASTDRVWIQELQRQLHEEQQGRSATIEIETAALRAQAEEADRAKALATQTAAEELNELRSQLASSRTNADVMLSAVEEEKAALRSRLEAVSQELVDSTASSSQAADALRVELDEARALQSAQADAYASEIASLQSQVDASAGTDSSLATARDSITSLERDLAAKTAELSALSDTLDEDAMKVARLESELSVKNQRVESLNKQLLAAASAATSASLPPPPSPRRGIPASPSIAEGLNLHHSGSLRERSGRLLGTSELPYTPSSRMEAVSEDREEIGRLNHTIETQKAIISDLTKQMLAWEITANRHREIIAQLLNGVPASSISFANLPTLPSSTSISTLSSLAPSTPPQSQQPIYTPSPSTPQPQAHLKKVQLQNKPIAALAESHHADNARTAPSTPTRAGGGGGWGGGGESPKPPPLLHAGHQRSNSQAKAARRVTIEHDLESLKGVSRVEQSRSLFNSPQAQQAQSLKPGGMRTPVAAVRKG